MAGLLTVVLLGLWFSLSAIVTRFVNKKIQRIGEYHGVIEKIHLNPWRGAYSIAGLRLVKVSGEAEEPFFYAEKIDFNVRWKALLNGAFVGDMEFFSPEINFIDADKPEEKQINLEGTGEDAKKATRELSPLRLDRILVHDGQIHFRRPDGDPPVDVFVRNIQAEARNLTNSKDLSQTLMATVEAKGQAMKSGDFDLRVGLDPFAAQPTFETRARIAFALPEVNHFLKHYAALEAKGGDMRIFIEGAAAEGKFKGYIKPLMSGVDLIEIKNDNKSAGDVIKGGLAKTISNIFENRKKNDNAAKIEIEGTFDDPNIKVFDAILSFLRNAFFEGISPGFEKKDEPHVTPQGKLSDKESEPEASEASPAKTA